MELGPVATATATVGWPRMFGRGQAGRGTTFSAGADRDNKPIRAHSFQAGDICAHECVTKANYKVTNCVRVFYR